MAEATAATTHLLFFLSSFLFLLPVAVTAVASGWDAWASGDTQLLRLHELPGREDGPLQLCSPQKSRREKGATILEMKNHRYCSSSFRRQEYRTEQLLASDEARVQYLHSKVKSSPSTNKDEISEAQIPLASGVKLQTLNYVVTVELSGRKTTVIVDTGSDLTWVQCKPCTYCYNQQDPMFDPSGSPSYQPVPCNSSACNSLQLATEVQSVRGEQAKLQLRTEYGDGSYSRGELARDQIDLAGTSVEGFIFGCGRSNHGLFGGASGLMGLGRSQLSLVSQTSTQFGGLFSYCLPPKEIESSGSLVLGGDYSVYRNTTPIVYTRMVTTPQLSPFYLLNLTGMSVGGVPLQASGFSNGRILIDSGTVITRLPPSIYTALKAEFIKQFSGYPSVPGFSILNTCFNLTGYKEVSIPTMKLQFEGGAEVSVDVTGVFYFVKKDASVVCLALASLAYESQLGIIGNYQQKNLRVVYDTMESKVGFAQEPCSYS